MHLFYSGHIFDQRLKILDREHHHCARVLRLKPGQIIKVTDGTGMFYICQIEKIGKDFTECRIEERIDANERELLSLNLAIAPTKNIERLEWCIEKCTEIGIKSVTPVWCEHSERKKVRLDRLQNVIVAAAKQSQKARFTKLEEPETLSDFLTHCSTDQKFIAHCNENYKTVFLGKIADSNKSMTILIGPEGDFSPPEIEASLNNGFFSVSLGQSRLRTETAGVFACSAIAALKEMNDEHIK